MLKIDTFDGAKPRFLNQGKKRRSVSTLSIPRASDRGVEWVDSEFLSFDIRICFGFRYSDFGFIKIAPENPFLWTGMKGASAENRKINQMLKQVQHEMTVRF